MIGYKSREKGYFFEFFMGDISKCCGDQEEEVLLASSIQAFETCMLMIGMQRYTAALVHLANAVEGLLRSRFGDGKFMELIDEIDQTEDISKALIGRAHQLRMKRNTFVHDKVLPRDNVEAVEFMFMSGFSVYEVFLNKIFEINL